MKPKMILFLSLFSINLFGAANITYLSGGDQPLDSYTHWGTDSNVLLNEPLPKFNIIFKNTGDTIGSLSSTLAGESPASFIITLNRCF